jgi:hypothetical protein
MGLRKGQTNNPGGRPKGQRNKVTKETRIFIQRFVAKNSRRLQKDFELLDPFQRVTVMERLFAYTAPKMSTVESNVTVENLTEAQLDEMFNRILKQSNVKK